MADPNDDWDDYPYFDEVRSLKKKQQKLNIDKQLFAIFWMLELPDLMVPEHMYEDLLKRKLSELDNQKEGLMTQAQYQSAQRGPDS